MFRRIVLFLVVVFSAFVSYAQVGEDVEYENLAEDTVSSGFEGAIYCPIVDSIIRYAFYKKPIAKYKYGAAGPVYFDCSGFVYHCFGKYGVTLPRSSREMFVVGRKIEKEYVQPGDLVFFSRGKQTIGHVGIVVEADVDAAHNFRFIHSSTNRTNVRVDNSASPNYAYRYKGARRVLECEDDGIRILPPDTVLTDTLPKQPVVTPKVEPAKPAPVAQQSTPKKYHKIKKGETLSSIARKYHTTVNNLKKWNHLHSDFIREGQRIVVGK